jgi:hypothetical protein
MGHAREACGCRCPAGLGDVCNGECHDEAGEVYRLKSGRLMDDAELQALADEAAAVTYHAPRRCWCGQWHSPGQASALNRALSASFQAREHRDDRGQER